MEEWRDVPGFPGYKINIDTPVGRCIKYYKNGKTRELNQTCKNGRVFWSMTRDGKEFFWQAARWIAFTYPELVQNEYFEGAEIDHITPLRDGGTNYPSNLRWVTHKENMNNNLTRKYRSEINKGNQ